MATSHSERLLLVLQRHAGLSAALAWTLIYLLSGWAETRTLELEYVRLGINTAPWEIPTWQFSSAAMSLLLVGLVGYAEARWPLRWGSLRLHVLAHAGMSVVYCLLHVGGMVALREVVYAMQGANYDFGPWAQELYYEYLKDVRSYIIVLTVLHYSRALLRRVQGEARLLDDSEPPEITSAPLPKRFVVRKLGREFVVNADRVDAALASGNYVNLHVDGLVYPLRSTMTQLEAQLDAETFQRVHRSAIVRVSAISVFEPGNDGDARLHLHSGLVVPCSRRYRAALRERLGG